MGWSNFAGSVIGTLGGAGLGFMVGGPVGAAIGAGIGAGAGGTIDTNRANADAVDAANTANIELWREQAAYNTPANQVARLRAAGLNPNLFYSQGDTGNMKSAPTIEPARYNYNFGEAFDKVVMYYQMANMAAQNRNLNAQTANIDAQTSMRRTEAELQKIQVDYFKKYGYFPNQGVPSMLRQTLQDVSGYSGRFMNNLDALREIAAQKINSAYGDSGMRAIDMALEAADKKHLTGQKRADFINDFIIKYNKAH